MKQENTKQEGKHTSYESIAGSLNKSGKSPALMTPATHNGIEGLEATAPNERKLFIYADVIKKDNEENDEGTNKDAIYLTCRDIEKDVVLVSMKMLVEAREGDNEEVVFEALRVALILHIPTILYGCFRIGKEFDNIITKTK